MNKDQRNDYLREWRRKNRMLNEVFEDHNSVHSEVLIDYEVIDHHEEDLEIPTDIECGMDVSSTSDQESSVVERLSDVDGNLADRNNGINEWNEEKTLEGELAGWVLKNKITRNATNELLDILRRNGHDELPKCTRTILKTPRSVLSKEKCGGDYIYLGIANGISRCLMTRPNYPFNSDTISLVVNVDGLPLYKSSSIQCWPILCMFDQVTPFIVALFVGTKKPLNLNEFLQDFIHEYGLLQESGYKHKELLLHVKIKAFVCDAPARQFIKGIKGHNGYHACERCTVEGTYESSRIVFSDIDCVSRDDESFKNELYMGTHQIEKSVLAEIGIKCVTQFPLDYMHLVCLGVMKRMLLAWKEGPRHQKLSPRQLLQISRKLKEYRGKMPFEFVRQPRGLEDVKRWKATEYSQFLLYTGCLVLKDVLPSEGYKHFISLSLAMRVLLDENDEIRNEFLNYAKDLLKYFVSAGNVIFGRTFTVYNVHNLLHLCEDSSTFNTSLDHISSFPFENYLQVIKKLVRKTQNPLSQIVKRVKELEIFEMNDVTSKQIVTKISVKEKDSWFMLKTGSFVQIKGINHDLTLEGDVITKRHFRNIFVEPCDSKLFSMVHVRNLNAISTRKQIDKKDLLRKSVCLPYKEGFAIVALLHDVSIQE